MLHLSTKSLTHFIKRLLFFSTNPNPSPNPAAAFLLSACHVSPAAAQTISAAIPLKSLPNSRQIISLLTLHHFSPQQISSLVQRYPKLLNSDPEKFIEPKLQFYARIGLPPSTISQNPQILHASLPNRLLPNHKLLNSLLDREKLISLLKKSPIVLKLDLNKVMAPRIQMLVDHNVPSKMISQMLFYHTRAFYPRNNKFEQAFEKIKKMGIGPEFPMFAHALGVFAQMPDGFWERNMGVYKEFGWGEEDVVRTFVKCPFCMSMSVEKLRVNLRFFKERLGWGAEFVSGHPVLLSLSLEKRLLPRFLTWELLRDKGLLEASSLLPYYFKMSKKDFLAKYVYKCMDKAPEVLELNKSIIV